VTELTWANHPNAALRLRLAEYLGRGWTIEKVDPGSAVVARPKQWTKPGRVLINPLYLLYFGRKDRRDRLRLTVTSNDQIIESRA
jgi:hypothetical protein